MNQIFLTFTKGLHQIFYDPILGFHIDFIPPTIKIFEQIQTDAVNSGERLCAKGCIHLFLGVNISSCDKISAQG